MAEPKLTLTADGGAGNSKYDELMRRIITAKDELFKREIEANTVILNGQKYSVLVKDGYCPSIFGMAVETEFLPLEWDFIVQKKFEQKPPQTNADRIRSMSDEELANAALNCYECPPIKECPQAKAKYDMPTKDRCVTCWLDWLQEVSE